MKNVSVPVTSYTEQRIIVNHIENNISIIDSNKNAIITSLNKCNLLKQSILKRAFSGGLVPQDPHDEHALVLLKRIKAENTKLKSFRRRKPEE